TWALGRRRAAAGLARGLPFPSHEDALWRRTAFRALTAGLPQLDPFAAPARARSIDELPAPIVERLAGETGAVALVVQRDGVVVFDQTPAELTRQGVIVCSFDRAVREHGAKLEPAFGSLLAPDYDRYVALGVALRSG